MQASVIVLVQKQHFANIPLDAMAGSSDNVEAPLDASPATPKSTQAKGGDSRSVLAMLGLPDVPPVASPKEAETPKAKRKAAKGKAKPKRSAKIEKEETQQVGGR